MGAPLLRGQGLKTQKSGTLGGVGNARYNHHHNPFAPFPPAAGFPLSPERTTLNGSLRECGWKGAEDGVWVLKQDTGRPFPWPV